MSEIVEEFFTGYCKSHNSTKRIFCEYSRDEDGYFSLEYVDCDFDKCVYNGECLVIQQALAKEEEP